MRECGTRRGQGGDDDGVRQWCGGMRAYLRDLLTSYGTSPEFLEIRKSPFTMLSDRLEGLYTPGLPF